MTACFVTSRSIAKSSTFALTLDTACETSCKTSCICCRMSCNNSSIAASEPDCCSGAGSLCCCDAVVLAM
jgi:hypothetical protein